MKKFIKNKYLFIGETQSINIELIVNSFNYLKGRVNYIIIGCFADFYNYLKLSSKKKIKLKNILDPLNFDNYDPNSLNIFDINANKNKSLNLIKQLEFSNFIANQSGHDLVTMPIDKFKVKKNIDFIGVTEYLGTINKKLTFMLMKGDMFSIVPYTTHINPLNISKNIKKKKINFFIHNLLETLEKQNLLKNFSEIVFLCYNPHCGENSYLGLEDKIIKDSLRSNFIKVKGPVAADSAFIKFKKNSLFLSTYHDQALIPFKILNKKAINMTVGLNFRRLSPAHGTAKDIINKNISDNSSYLSCMLD